VGRGVLILVLVPVLPVLVLLLDHTGMAVVSAGTSTVAGAAARAGTGAIATNGQHTVIFGC
jgi:hypothetical protein